MLKKVGLLFFAVLILFSCSKGNDNEGNTTKKGDKVVVGDSVAVKRKKIDKLTPKNFIQVTIDLTKQKEKWRMSWREFIQDKRKGYFKSYGLSESKFNAFAQGNSSEIQNFLKDNPRYNKMYMDAMRNVDMNP